MIYFDTVNSRSIVVKFICDKCGELVVSEEIDIPSPNYQAENAGNSFNETDDMAFCENCDKGFYISVLSGFSGGYVSVAHFSDDYEIEIIENPYDEDRLDAILGNTEFYNTFKQEINNLRDLNNVSFSKTVLEKTLRQLIYVGAITSLETYLSDAFINTILSNERYLQNFVETFDDFKKEKIVLSNIFKEHDKIIEKAKKSMLDVLYHNLAKVSNMYKDALNIEFPPIGDSVKAVSVRHDLVHRNGKTKDGKQVEITQKVVFELLATIEEFVEKIDNQLGDYAEYPF